MIAQLINALVLGSVLLLFSLGLSLAWGALDVLNLAHGALFIFGGYLGYRIGESADWPFPLVILVCMAGAGLAAVVIEVVAFGPIRARIASKRQAELAALVASLGASIVLGQLVANWTNNVVFAPSAKLFTVHEYVWGSVRVGNIDIIVTVAAIAVAVAIQLWVSRSRQGRAVRALAYAPTTASLMGVNVRMLGITTMFISGAAAGLAGLLLSIEISGETTATGQTYLLSAFAIIVVGGVGSILGAAVASYVIAIAETAIVAYGPSGYSTGVAFALIFVFLLFRPQGLFARRLTARV
jgi:branched-chain amino acid transport system permease protein